MSFHQLLLLFLVLVLAACGGKNSNQVSLKLTDSLAFGGSTLAPYSTGGLMIWGKAQSGESFAKVLRNSETFNISLPNSVWRFYAMAWQSGSSLELQADEGLRCAITSPIDLKGGDSSVPLNLSAATCDAAPEFRGNLTSLASMNLNMHTCEDVTDFNNVDDRCQNNRDGTFYVSDKVPVRSVKVILEAYGDKIDMPSEAGLSRCLPFPGTDEAMVGTGTANVVLPQGSMANASQNPFRITLLYDVESDDCSTPQSRMIRKALSSGFAQTPSDSKIVISGNSLHFAQALTDVELCKDRENTEPFAGGAGTTFLPYLICSERQLYSIHDSSAYNNASFRLGKSLNLLNYMKGSGVNPSDLPADSNCWEIGQTWQPVGLTYSACEPETGTASFKGNFDGNGHTIEGLLMRYENADHIGFFSAWEAEDVGQYIRDLKFKKVEISANKSIGTLFGSRGFASNVKVEGIELIDAELEARDRTFSDVGGLFGSGERVELSKIRILDTTIKYEGSNVGGVFGRLTESLGLSQIYSAAHLIPRYKNDDINLQSLGGIGGSLVSPSAVMSNFQELAHEGIIESILLDTGGLFGTLTIFPTQTLSHFYVNSAIMNSLERNLNIGGIVGTINSEMTLSKGYFSGSLIDRCVSVCSRGLIFGSKGAVPVTGQNLFAYMVDQPPNVGTGDTFELGYAPDDVVNQNAGGTLYDTAATTALDAPFIKVQGALPRLLNDRHPCVEVTTDGQVGALSLPNQVALNLGSANRPLRVCRKEHIEQLESLPSGRVARVYGGVNLSGTYTSPSIPANVVLDGKPGFVYGHSREGVHDNTFVFAPFNINHGEIKNLKLGNIQIDVTGASAGGVASGFLKQNYGIVNNVSLLSGVIKNSVATIFMKTAGFVSNNHGVIKNSLLKAYLSSPNYLSGFVTLNSRTELSPGVFSAATISNSRVEPTIIITQPTQNVVGIVTSNLIGTTLSRMYLGGNLESTDSVSGIYPVASQNVGTIEDIEIGSDFRWETAISGPFALVSHDNSPMIGEINRVVMKGLFVNTDNSTDAYNPTDGQNVEDPAGTISGIYNFSPIGRRIAEINGSEHSCIGTELTLNQTYYTPPAPFSTGDNYFTFDATVGTSKHVWVVVENNGRRNAALVTGLTVVNPITLTLNQNCDDIGFNETDARANIIQSYHNIAAEAIGNIVTPPYNGVLTLYDFDANAFAGTVWDFNYIDPENDIDDFELMLDYFLAELFGQPPVAIPPWEIQDSHGPSLLTIKR